jgi:D-3-phosphoglycerate dehydrogenase / 2-oxoglutarate reductase
MNKKVLITDIADPYLAENLSGYGFQVDYLPDISLIEVEKIIHQYAGIIITTKISLTRNTLEKAKLLEFIARAGSGMDHVDVGYATIKGIYCITSPEANSGSVGEHCVGMLLAITHNIVRADRSVEKYEWKTDEFRVNELTGKTIGIIGYGNTGPAFAKLIKPFGVNIIAYDKYRKKFSDGNAEEATMQRIFDEADVFSIHLPLTTETNNLIGLNFLKSFKKKIILLNTSRGFILNLINLLTALDKQIITAAGLDVIDNENFSSHSAVEREFYNKIFNHPKIIVTPHIAGKSLQTRFFHAKILATKIAAIYKL